MDFLFQPNSMLAIWLIIARSLLPYNPVKNSLYKILMESTYLSLSQSEFYQESIRSIRTLSGCVGKVCHGYTKGRVFLHRTRTPRHHTRIRYILKPNCESGGILRNPQYHT